MARVVPLLAAASILTACSTGGPPSTEDLKLDAQRVCHGFVKDRLKSPSTAKFSQDQTTGSGMAWEVQGAVDAQNSFGAALRSTYDCRVTYDTVSNKWTLQALDGLD